jgi:hypothetical protein
MHADWHSEVRSVRLCTNTRHWPWFQASAAMLVRSVLFRDITQRRVVIITTRRCVISQKSADLTWHMLATLQSHNIRCSVRNNACMTTIFSRLCKIAKKRLLDSSYLSYRPVCLSVCLPACLSVCLSVSLSVCLSVCLFFRPTWNNSIPTRRIFIKFYIWWFFGKSVEKIQGSLKSDKNKGYFTWRPLKICDIISLNSS